MFDIRSVKMNKLKKFYNSTPLFRLKKLIRFNLIKKERNKINILYTSSQVRVLGPQYVVSPNTNISVHYICTL